ncbi:MAG: TatD family hydrolase [Candidatus Bathyarchaeia archaeon]
MIDSHCHITHGAFDLDRDLVIQNSKRELRAIITCASSLDELKFALKLSEKYPKFIHVTAGIHPVDAAEMSNEEFEEFLSFIELNKDKIVGIGEVGLDYHWIKDADKMERSKRAFIKLIDFANSLDLPLVLHLRGSFEEGFDIVKSKKVKKAMFHCFYGRPQLAEKIIEEGYLVSIATNIVRNKNMKRIAKKSPLSGIVTETDSPFLSVDSNTDRNDPQNIKLVIRKMAESRDEDFSKINEITTRNSIELFNLDI